MARTQEQEQIVLPALPSLKPKRIDIPIDKLLPSRYQTRDDAYEREEDLEQLAHLIQLAGLDPVPVARPHPDKPGFYEIIKGHRRKKSIEKFLSSWRTVPCDVFEGLSENTVLFMVGQDNSGRRAFYPYEKGRYYRIWSKKIGSDKIAKLFSVRVEAVWSWIRLADDIDFLVEPLDPETRNKFILNASRDIIDEIKKVKTLTDRSEICKMVAAGDGIDKVREFVLASVNSSQRSSLNNLKDKQKDPEDRPVKQIIKTLNEAQKSQTYDELREKFEELRGHIMPTLDKYIQMEETVDEITNAKESATIRVVKAGTMQVIHQVDNKGNGLCIHQTKNGKKPIVAKFKIQV